MSFLNPFSKKKKIKKHKPTTPKEKEEAFVRIGTKILMFLVIIFAIAYSIVNTFGGENGNSLQKTFEFTKIFEACDESQIVNDPLDSKHKTTMLQKISSSGLDIVENNSPSYSKFDRDEIGLNSSVSFTAQEAALLYTYTTFTFGDGYNMVIYQYSISSTGNDIIIKMVSTLNFTKLYTNKVKSAYDKEVIDSFPKRIYVINTAHYNNGGWVFEKALFNNMTEQESNTMKEYINLVTPEVNFDEYSPMLVINFFNDLATKTGSVVGYNENQVSLIKQP